MSADLLQTKLYLPRLRPLLVPRPRLIEILDQGVSGKLTLISAPAGFGKTTLVSSWVERLQTAHAAAKPKQIAWLSLDENDGEPARFLSYLIAALQRFDPRIGASALRMLQGSPPPIPTALTALLNDVAAQPDPLVLVLDDYHVIDARPVDEALAFLLEHAPPQLHVALTTREDPNLPLARLRARGLLTELRSADLRFTLQETADFLQGELGLDLQAEQIAALEARTEGWIAGLQMAALSMRSQEDIPGFIQSFTGSHRFVMDYLLEEVLDRQPAHVQAFLLKTAILNRLSASLCDALTNETDGQEILESLDRGNLFLVPLDNERRWYRYHHLFLELLRQRLKLRFEAAEIEGLHLRAAGWFEANGLELEAFRHATAAGDMPRALRLIDGNGLPLYFRGEAIPVRQWLESLPEAEFRAIPALWVTYASVLTLTGRLHDNIEEILENAETALQDAAPEKNTADLLGQVAAIRAMLAVTKNQVETIVTQSRRALELLAPENGPMRTTTTWTLGYAYQLQGKRAEALEAYAETIARTQKSGNLMTEIAATTCVGQIQEAEKEYHEAAESFRRVLELVGDPPWPAACEACVGLGRIHYHWNDLEAAERFGQQGLALARQLENVDTPAACGVLLARVKLAQGDAAAAARFLAEAERFARQRGFDHWLEEIAFVRIQSPTKQQLPEPLSERELEVLKLLATELTGPEIARELMISLNTMRTHTKNIYSKLGIHSRRTAVRRAEELALV